MREILFRGKIPNTNTWVKGDLIKDYATKSYRIKPRKEIAATYPVVTESIGQYTGLKDRYNTKVFEGDIILSLYDDVAVIQYDEDDAMFYVNNSNVLENFGVISPKWIEVIGNVFDNPDMIGDL